MKKRMFFTTVLIIALLIVALSTATFAWFSASNVVNVSIITFTASSSDVLNGDLAISWEEDGSDNYEIQFAPAEDMRPMIPKALPLIGQGYDAFIYTEKEGATVSNFHSSVQAYDESGDYYYYAGAVISESPTVCNSADGKEEFFLINKNEEFGMKVSVEYKIGGDIEAALRVAMFADGELVGIMGGSGALHYGDIVGGNRIDEQPSVNNLISASGAINFTISAGETKKMKLVAWYDGAYLDNSGKEKTAMLTSLRFSGEYVA